MNRQTISTINPEAIFLDDAFDQAILGVANDADGDLVAVYSQKQCINILNVDGIEDDDFDYDIALENFENYWETLLKEWMKRKNQSLFPWP